MSIAQHCRPDVVTAGADESVRTGARLMEQRGIGAVVVVDEAGAPLGIVTDRDIVRKALRRGRDPEATRLGEIMSEDVFTMWEGAPLVQAFRRMRQEGLRRIIVMDDENHLRGILTVDDVMPIIAAQLGAVGDVITAQLPIETGRRD